jgi:hypothetical protein
MVNMLPDRDHLCSDGTIPLINQKEHKQGQESTCANADTEPLPLSQKQRQQILGYLEDARIQKETEAA